MSHDGPPRVDAGSRRPTIKDVARIVGVDQSLVSRVVNNDPKASASPATRQRILEVVEQLGYSASVMARGLRTARTDTIGLLLPDLTNPMYASIVRGAETQALARDFGIVIGTHVEGERQEPLTRLLQQRRVDGLLVASGVLRDDFMRKVATTGAGPVVLVNRRVRGVTASVVVDDAAGARTAADHLTSLGHRKIAGLFGPSAIDTTLRRRKGFEQGCSAAGINPTVVELSSWGSEHGYHGAQELLRKSTRPTAIFASTLAVGIGVLRAAREMAIDVPHKLSVVALHDAEIADYLAPPLTTVVMPSEKMGAYAVDLLVSMIGGGAPRQVFIKDTPTLVVRSSTARRP